MPYGETKVYFDGSHYIAIPHTTNPHKRRKKPKEEEITIVENKEKECKADYPVASAEESATEEAAPIPLPENISGEKSDAVTETQTAPESGITAKKTTRKDLFDNLYREHISLPRAKRLKAIVKGMRPYFDSEKEAVKYVEINLERKYRNFVSRRIRLLRKVNLREFNYFVTFTYDDTLHTEASFRKKLRNTLSHLCSRKGWRYVGVWERSPEKKRLHFHGIFYIPDGTLKGKMENVNSYSFSAHKRQITKQSEYFRNEFGRNDFEPLDDKRHIGDAVAYILKYIEKSGEKIVYSRDLPQYFISDIMDEDIVCPFGLEDKKLLLFDDFNCWDEGCLMGKVSAETIDKMRKSN